MAETADQDPNVSYRETLPIWWSCLWRYFVLNISLFLLWGIFLKIVYTTDSSEFPEPIDYIIWLIFFSVASFWALKATLKKREVTTDKIGMYGEVTYKETFPIWWSWYWRTLLGSLAFTVVFAAAFGFFLGLIGFGGYGGPVGEFIGNFSFIPMSLWAMRAMIRKHQLPTRRAPHIPSSPDQRDVETPKNTRGTDPRYINSTTAL